MKDMKKLGLYFSYTLPIGLLVLLAPTMSAVATYGTDDNSDYVVSELSYSVPTKKYIVHYIFNIFSSDFPQSIWWGLFLYVIGFLFIIRIKSTNLDSLYYFCIRSPPVQNCI